MAASENAVNILLVDDQPAKLLSYEVTLAELGENLVRANSAREALQYLVKSEVAVILVDVSMPEIDGFELAEMIREHPRFEKVAIIFVSAIHLTELDRLRGYEAGAVDYLPVPVVPALLRAKVRVFCDLYRKTRQLETINSELEGRVAERTAQLEAANLELEARVEARTREREEALARIAEMQKFESLGQLTGGLAHDFNNLLMVVLSGLQLAKRHAPPDSKMLVWLDRAKEAAESGAILTKRMLAFARRQVLKPENFRLTDVIPAMVDMMSHSLGPMVKIEVDVPFSIPPVRIDRNQFELAVLNLGLNARDAMPNGGKLSISARNAEGPLPEGLAHRAYVIVSVGDTGVGMDAETVKRASEPFFTTKGAGKGSGLGLSMVQGLTLQSGGAMTIESRRGEGSTISLWLPVAEGAPDPIHANVSAPTVICSARKVLLVDDDPRVLSATVDMLYEIGHAPIAIGSPAEAVKYLESHEPPDVAILDFAMPEMTGAELAEKIREIIPGLPIFLATGYADVVSDISLPRVDKPYSLGQLAKQIELAVSIQPSQQVRECLGE